MNMMRAETKPIVCVDFDGVLNNYTGWRDGYMYLPREGARDFLHELSYKYTIAIFTARPTQLVKEWLDTHKMPYDFLTNEKIGAVAYIDDRAICFKGDFEETMEELLNFKTHWEKDDVWDSND